jgi:hypothetical protein
MSFRTLTWQVRVLFLPHVGFSLTVVLTYIVLTLSLAGEGEVCYN